MITREKLRDWGTTNKRLVALVPPGGVTLETILRAESVYPEDRVWVATRPGVLEDSLRQRWLGRIVRRALDRVQSPDPRSLAVLEYLDRGETIPSDVVSGASDAYYDTYAQSAAVAAYAALCYVSAAIHYADVHYAASQHGNANAERRAQVADLLSLLEES